MDEDLASAYVYGIVKSGKGKYEGLSYNEPEDVRRLCAWVEEMMQHGRLNEEQAGEDAWRVINGIQRVYERAVEIGSRVYIEWY